MADAPDGESPVELTGQPPGAETHAESALTVAVAFGANLLIAIAKTAAAVVTASASMLAEAAHSWADTGNEVFLIIAQRRAAKAADTDHPFGYGREVYVWSLFAAIGLFAVGAGVSITHGISELADPEPASDFGVAYAVLAVAFVLEAISFRQASRQARREAATQHQDLLDHILATSDPTVRAVFFEDAAALVGVVVAAAGIGLHQVTGSPVPDAVGSILVGILLGVVAVVLIDRNRRFLVGQVVDPQVRDAAVRSLLSLTEVERVTMLRLEFVGARQVYLTGAVDLAGNMTETDTARVLASLERRLARSPAVVGATLTLSLPEDPAL